MLHRQRDCSTEQTDRRQRESGELGGGGVKLIWPLCWSSIGIQSSTPAAFARCTTRRYGRPRRGACTSEELAESASAGGLLAFAVGRRRRAPRALIYQPFDRCLASVAFCLLRPAGGAPSLGLFPHSQSPLPRAQTSRDYLERRRKQTGPSHSA